MKTTLQLRAESLSSEFKSRGRKPVVIEFAGTPKAGKTTTLSTLNAFLKRCGFKTEVVVERASVCPIRDKKHSNFNIWTACTTLAQILEKIQNPPRPDDPEILILDRGLFDSIAWLAMMERLARIRSAEREAAEQFLLLPDWRKRISGVIVMTASPSDAMVREGGDLPVEGASGSIMNEAVLAQFKENALSNCERLQSLFRIFKVNTSDPTLNRKKTAEMVAGIVLDIVAEQLEEEILCVRKKAITALFQQRLSLIGVQAQNVADLFLREGEYIPRAAAETDKDLVQALPIVVVLTKSGQVLLLRRREKSSDNPLHDRLVIWAGGHVRKEDASNGNSLVQGALRELQEELRLSLEPADLALIGAIYSDFGGSTSKHVAVVYQWRATTDDVTVVLSHSEFYERRGTSLSGRFVAPENLRPLLSSNPEAWSEQIAQNFLAKEFGTKELSLL